MNEVGMEIVRKTTIRKAYITKKKNFKFFCEKDENHGPATIQFNKNETDIFVIGGFCGFGIRLTKNYLLKN